MQNFTLNIGKFEDGSEWLCLADADTRGVYPLAKFESSAHTQVFQEYMGTQGYASVRLTSDQEIEDLLNNGDATES